jgi:hypothetical protein
MASMTYERNKGRSIDSNNVQIHGSDMPLDVSTAASGAGIEIDHEAIYSTAQLDDAAFWAQPVEIHLHDAQSENEPMFAEVTVNGKYELIVRGQQKSVSRAHLAVLAQAKQMRIKQQRITNPDGSMGYKESAVLQLTYPFSVIHDAHPKGGVWLRELLKAPV